MSDSATVQRSLENARVRFAYRQVLDWKGGPHWKDIAPMLKGLPVSLRTQGLTLTLAMLMRKSDAARRTAEALSRWLLQESPIRLLEGAGTGSTPESLLYSLIGAPRSVYLATQSQAEGLVKDLKLLAGAFDHE